MKKYNPTRSLYRSKLNRRLSLRFALTVIAFSTLFVVLSTTLQLFLGYRKDTRVIEDNVRFTEQSYLPSIANGLYKLDEDLLRLLLKGALQLRGIEYCQVSEEQETGAFQVTEGHYPGKPDIVRHFPLACQDQRGEPVTIGTLTVAASFQSAHERLWGNVPLYTVSSALVIFLTAFVVLVLFQRLVARHLGTMARYTQTLDIDNLEPRLDLDRPPRQDELDQVADAINDLRLRLRQDMAERKKAEAALQASHDRFQVLMDSLDTAVYVVDMQSYEVLFVNQRGRERWGDVVGQVCWQTLQAGQNAPCAFCTNAKLVDEHGGATGTCVWEMQNSLDGQWYECRDQAICWTDGRLVRMEIATNITARKRAAEALRESEQRMEMTLRGAELGTWDWNVPSGEITFNERWAAMLGYSLDEIEPHISTWEKLVHPDDMPDVMEFLNSHLEGKSDFYEAEHRLKHKSGAWIWILDKGRVITRDAEGKPLRACGTHLDITARKQTEEALRLSQERYRNFVEQSTEGIWMAAFDEPIPIDLPAEEQARRIQNLVYVAECNDAMARMYGYASSQELVGLRLLQLYGVSSEVNFQIILELVRAGYRFNNRETQELTASGETVYFLNNAVGIIQGGHLTAIWGTQQDITPLKQAEQALRESEEKLRSLVEQAYDAIVLSDEQGRVIQWNRAAEQLTGYSRDEMLGRPFWEIQLSLMPQEKTSPDMREKLAATMKQGLQTGDLPWLNQSVEAELQKADGTRCYFQQVAFPIKSAQGFMIGTFVRDITERKQAEQELGRYREHLEELVEERTRELKEAQAELLRQERLSALGQLTATVAHEIRNPLGTVRTAVFAIGDAIEREQLGRVERARQLAERNILRCDRIITELLDYTRERALDLKLTQIDPWLETVLVEQIIPAPIVCTRELNAGVEILVDSENLRRAVINVVNNAVDALQDAKAIGNELIISTRINEERLEMRFKDTGCGIPPDALDKIFEPLFSTKSFGIGLGLPIVKSILEQHGGGVEVQSTIPGLSEGKAGQGTTVTLWLPAISSPADDPLPNVEG